MAEANVSGNEDFKYIVRLANTDIDGEKGTAVALQGVKGVGARVAEILIKKAGLSRQEKIGTLSDEKVEELEELIQNYGDIAPPWALNRQNDYETGDDVHLIGANLEMSWKDDVNRMKMIRCYRGIRHEGGHKVRGQRTRSNGRTGIQLGVSRTRQQPQKKQ